MAPSTPAGSSGSPWTGPVVVAVLLLLIAVVAGGDDGGSGSREGAAATPAAAARPAGPAVPASVRTTAARLDPQALVSQLFLVDARDAPASATAGWGAVLGSTRESRTVSAQPGGARPVAALEVSTDLPEQPPLGEADLQRVRRAYLAAGRRIRASGAEMALGLSADVGVSAGAFTDIVFADEPGRVAARVRAALDALAAAGVAAAVAHFPGQGTATQEPLDGPSGVSLTPAALRARDLVPFREVLRRAPAVVVSSATYAAWGGATPASTSPEVVQDELRGRLGFRGVAMTDDLEGVAVATGGSLGDAAVAALKAGIDLVWVGDEAEATQVRKNVLAAVASRELPESRLREAALRVLELKRRAGLLR